MVTLLCVMIVRFMVPLSTRTFVQSVIKFVQSVIKNVVRVWNVKRMM